MQKQFVLLFFNYPIPFYFSQLVTRMLNRHACDLALKLKRCKKTVVNRNLSRCL